MKHNISRSRKGVCIGGPLDGQQITHDEPTYLYIERHEVPTNPNCARSDILHFSDKVTIHETRHKYHYAPVRSEHDGVRKEQGFWAYYTLKKDTIEPFTFMAQRYISLHDEVMKLRAEIVELHERLAISLVSFEPTDYLLLEEDA